jgi:hypothetical protein
MKSERVLPLLGMLVALAMVVVFIARRRAGVNVPDGSEAPSDGVEAPSDGEADSSDQSLDPDPLVDEMGRESFPASDPPATY